jgi:hypothetical protein
MSSRAELKRVRPLRIAAVFALFSVLVVALGPIAALAHEVVVPHRVCEHGQRVHADDAGDESSAGDDSHDPKPSRDSERHHHCDLASSARQLATGVVGVAVPPALIAEVSPALDAPTRDGKSSLSLLLFAPKTSPPAFAKSC